MSKIYFVLAALLSCNYMLAQTTAPGVSGNLEKENAAPGCSAAKDSLKNRLLRGEVSFYKEVKMRPGYFELIIIDKYKYRKVAYQKNYLPAEFISCYNTEAATSLQSEYHIDLNSTDSFLHVYDKSGKGYRNAEFPGGPVALMKYMNKNISLPGDIKSDNNEKLRVYYSFFIDEKGIISDIQLVRSNCKVCEEAILSAIKKMPPFIPATEAGMPKKIKYILPYTKT